MFPILSASCFPSVNSHPPISISLFPIRNFPSSPAPKRLPLDFKSISFSEDSYQKKANEERNVCKSEGASEGISIRWKCGKKINPTSKTFRRRQTRNFMGLMHNPKDASAFTCTDDSRRQRTRWAAHLPVCLLQLFSLVEASFRGGAE